MKKLSADINDSLNAKFSPGEKIVYLLPQQSLPYLELNPPGFDRAGINEQEAEDAVQQFLPAAFDDLAKPSDHRKPATNPATGKLPPTPGSSAATRACKWPPVNCPTQPSASVIAHSYTPNGGWYVMIVSQAFQMQGHRPDRHQPLHALVL